MPELNPRHVLVGLLLGALALAGLILYSIDDAIIGSWPSPASLVIVGAGLGYTGLAGLYLALGRQPLLARVMAATCGAMTAGIISTRGEGNSVDFTALWCGVMLFMTLVIATPIVYLWVRGLRLVHFDDSPGAPQTLARRFSLWGAMVLITCVAIVLGVARNLQFPLESLYIVLLLCATTGGIAWMAAGALLSRLPLAGALVLLLVTAMVAGVALLSIGPGGLWEMIGVTLAEATVIGAAMLVLRMAGYRLHWPSYEALPSHPLEKPPPTAAKAQSNHSSEQSNLG